MRERADVLVIGTGVVGLGLAFELARRGVSTAVVGDGSTSSVPAAGLVNAQTRLSASSGPFQDLALLSRHLLVDWLEAVEGESGLPVEYDVRGGMAVALTDPEEVELDRALDWQRARSLPFDVLEGEEAVLREPSLSDGIRTAFGFPLDGMISPERLLRSLSLAARSAGARFLDSSRPLSLVTEGGRVKGVETTCGRTLADAVVDAGDAPGGFLPGQPRKPETTASILLASLDASSDPDRLSRFVLANHTWIVPRRDGTMVLASDPSAGGSGGGPRAGGISALIESAARAVPAVRDYVLLSFQEVACSVSPDHDPVLGESGLPGYFLASGLGADRVLLAPAAALFVSDLLTRKAPPLPAAPFDPARFQG